MQLVNLLWIGLLTFPQAFALDACAGQKFGYKAVDPADPHAYYLCFGLLGKIRNNCAEGFRFNVKSQNCAQVPQSSIQLKNAGNGVRNEFNINQNITMDRPIIFNIFGGLWNKPPIPPFFPPKPTFRPPTPPTIDVSSTESSSSSSEALSTESPSSSSVASSTESSSSSSEASSTASSSSSSEATSTESSSSSSEASSTESSSSSSEASSTESSSSSSEASSTESSSSSSEASSTESSSSSSEASSTESSSSSSEASSTESSSSSSEASSTESSSSSSEASSTESSSSSSEDSSTESSSSSSEASSTESSSSSSKASSTDNTEDTTESSTSNSENSTTDTSDSTSEDSTQSSSSSSDNPFTDSSSSSSEPISTDSSISSSSSPESSTSEDADPSESSTDSLITSSEESSTSEETDPAESSTEASLTSSKETETEDTSSSENPIDETTESEDTNSSTSETPLLSKPIRADVGKLGKKLENILWIPTEVEAADSVSEFDKSAPCALLPSGAYLRDPMSCANFYVCANGRAILRKCPRNLYFDIESKVCNLPNLVDCSQQQESISIPKLLTYSFGNTVGSSIGTTQSDEDVIEDSYLADNELSTSLDSSALTTEDLDDELEEDSETSESPTLVYTEEDIFDFDVFDTNDWEDTTYFDEESICSSQPNGVHLRHPNSCSKFYICASGRAVLRSCPSSLYFDIKKRVCNFPAAVDCSINEDESGNDEDPSLLTDKLPKYLSNTLRRAKSPKTRKIDSVTSGSNSIQGSATKMEQTKLSSPEILKTNNAALSSAKSDILSSQNSNSPKEQGNLNNDLIHKGTVSSTNKVISKDTSDVKQIQSKLSVSESLKSKETTLASPIILSKDQGKPYVAQNLKADLPKEQGKQDKDLISKAAVSLSTKTVIASDTSELKNEQSKLSVSESLKSKETPLPSPGKYLSEDQNKLDKDLTSKTTSSSTKTVIAKDTSQVKQEQSKLSVSKSLKSKETPLPLPILVQSKDQSKQNIAQSLKADLSKDQGKLNKALISKAAVVSSTKIIAKDTSEVKQDQSKLTDSLKSKEIVPTSLKTDLSKIQDSPEKKESNNVILPPTKSDISKNNTSGVIQKISESKQGQNQLLGPTESKDQMSTSVVESLNSNEKELLLMKSILTKDVSKSKEELSKVESAKSSETVLLSTKTVTSNKISIPQQGKELMPKSDLTDSKSSVQHDPTKPSLAVSLKSSDAVLSNEKSSQNLEQRKLPVSDNLKSKQTYSPSTKSDLSKEQIKPGKIVDVKSNKTVIPSEKSNLFKNTPKPEDKHFKPTVVENLKHKEKQLSSTKSDPLMKQVQSKPSVDENLKAQEMSLAQSKADLSKTTLKAEQNKTKPTTGLKSKETVVPAAIVDLSKEASQLKMVQTQPAVGSNLKSNGKVLYSTKTDHSKEHDIPSAAEALKYIENLISSTLFDLSKNASALKNLQIVSKAENIIVPLEDAIDSKCSSLPNGAFIRDPNLCAKFYVCSNGRAIPHSCPNVLYFDIKKKVCNFPSLVDCTSDEDYSTAPQSPLSPTDDSPSEPDDSPTPDCSLFPNGEYVRHPRSCSKFYVCANGKAIPRQCPKGLYIDTEIKYCNYPSRVRCTIEVAPSPSISVITGTEVNCINKRDGTTMRDSELHNKYYVCRNGTPVTHFCDPGKWFDLNRGVCDQKQLVDHDPLVPWL
ncbi:PREDICTED: serine-rich adhesin for platelets isoform X4 [Drosophila arizonae]|uniref:Serine-rich adhesin for platelets isoform X4 n=1 Tax=Drosophila arizonae TaxID=7263 RepID=A0ABM1PB39_DROAR|nr:PREDICTED: serine-rich adhesin for platelets isoform X4 [Drosophila arizonae]